MNDKTHQIINNTGKDLSGHPVSEEGYLVNLKGDIVTREHKVLFKSKELKNGEFPKIFKFSKIELSLI